MWTFSRGHIFSEVEIVGGFRLAQSSLALDVDPGSESESRKRCQGWPGCLVAQPLPIYVFFSNWITFLDVVAFVFLSNRFDGKALARNQGVL